MKTMFGMLQANRSGLAIDHRSPLHASASVPKTRTAHRNETR